MRVERWFAFVDLSGFTSFGDEFGDDESVRVLTLFRSARAQRRDRLRCAHRQVAGRRMHVGVGRAGASSSPRCASSKSSSSELELPLAMHAGMAGGAVILLEGDDYTGRCVNLAARLADGRPRGELLSHARARGASRPRAPRSSRRGWSPLPGLHDPVEVVRIGAAAERARDLA